MLHDTVIGHKVKHFTSDGDSLPPSFFCLVGSDLEAGQTWSYQMGSFTVGAVFLILLVPCTLQRTVAITDPHEVDALRAIKQAIGDTYQRLSNWAGDDPCGSLWTGVKCANVSGTNHVQELRLLNMNLTGILAPEFGNLSHLTILDVMWNNLTGFIPAEIGKLSNLSLLLLNGNQLTGTLPQELGNLSMLRRLQIDENTISGRVPTTFQYLNQAKHFHMNNNSLTGSIPPELGRLQNLLHLLLDNNDLSGELPPEISNISTLRILQLDNNHFNGTIPSNYSNMPNLVKLSLRNCSLTGEVPNISGLSSLAYLDLSLNSLSGRLSSGALSSDLTTIDLSFNQLDGELPADFYSAPNMELLAMRNNSLDGNITAANLLQHAPFKNADSVFVLDLENNNFTQFLSGLAINIPNITFRLFGNPVCNNASELPPTACQDFMDSSIANVSVPSSPVTLPPGCSNTTCDASRNQQLVSGLLAEGQCVCAYPLILGYRLKSPSFVIFEPYEESFDVYLSSALNLSTYQVDVTDYSWEPGPRLRMIINLFPSSDAFNQSEVARLFNAMATWVVPDNNTFGPYEVLFFDIEYPYNVQSSSGGKHLSGGAIAGIVIGAAVITAIVVTTAMLFLVRHQRTGPYQFAQHHERIKVAGVKDFTYEEMAKATKNFDNKMQIGQGGYGKVYKGFLADGKVVAIKRAEQGSLQGFKEFYTEIELLSRVHHRNLVSLIGCCDDQGEQMLVYEFMPNGTLREHLNPESKVPLDFVTRLQIALGSAKGILYLHTEANPPIFHRDIKASNILLDEKRRAKVADFGLSRLAPAGEIEGAPGGHVSTVVKGTPGYLDPEYFLTHKLTDKSDVYSFGVVLLELITGMQPIFHGKNLVREANLAYDAGVMLSIVDSRLGPYPSECLEPLVRLALSCCKDETDLRPSMADVVRELEAIWRQTPIPESLLSFEASTDTQRPHLKHPKLMGSSSGLGSGNPYLSSDIDGSSLMSGTITNVAPR